MADPAGQVAEYTAGLNPNSVPGGIAAGPDGNLWFTDDGTTKAIGRIDPSTGQITEYTTGLNAGSRLGSIVVGPNGNLWFTDAGGFPPNPGEPPAIGRVDPSTGQSTEYSAGLNANSLPSAIAAGPDGNLWFTDQGCTIHGTCAIGRFDPSTGQITEFTAGLNANSIPSDIAEEPDGNLWFTDQGCLFGGTCAIGRIDMSTGQITEFTAGLNPNGVPRGIAAGSDGNLWFTDDGSTKAIGRIDASTGQITEYSAGLPPNSFPDVIAAGPDGNLWFADDWVGAIGRIDPSTGQITEFPAGLNDPAVATGAIPGPGGIVAGADGNLWFTDAGTTKLIGRIGAGATASAALSGPGQVGVPELCQTSFASWAGVSPSISLFSFDGYRWLRDGAPIAGQSAQSYTPSSADAGNQLSCSETVTYPSPFLVTVPASSPAITVQLGPSTSPTPGPTPQLPQAVLGGLKLSPRSFSLAGRKVAGRCIKPTKHNTHRPSCTQKLRLTIRYTLNTATTVTFRIAGRLPGRRLADRCVTQTEGNRDHQRCTHHVTLRGVRTRANAGTNTLVLARNLAPGAYTLTATPTDGNPQHATFKITPDTPEDKPDSSATLTRNDRFFSGLRLRSQPPQHVSDRNDSPRLTLPL